MPPVPNVHARHVCEEIIRKDKLDNIDKNIWKSKVVIADRLLRRSLELGFAYDELYEKLHLHQHALATFLGLVQEVAALWKPEDIANARAGRDKLGEVNRKIADSAAELVNLLQRRADLHENSRFSSDTFYHICDVINAAGEKNHRYTSYVRDGLGALRSRFDMKYWPSLSEFSAALAMNAAEAISEATDPVTEAATAASRPSLADFFKGLFVDIEEQKKRNHGYLPNDLAITDGTMASLVNCALDLDADDTLTGIYVKGIRQRQRKSSR